MQRFSKVMKLAFDNEWVSRNPVKGLGEKKDKVEIGFLTEEEVNAFENVTLPVYLSIARDMFLFSVYTGTPFGDMCELTNKNIKPGIDHSRWLKYTRGKTENAYRCPCWNLPKQSSANTKAFTKTNKVTSFSPCAPIR